jgi:phosphonate transport system substrate-binding protein
MMTLLKPLALSLLLIVLCIAPAAHAEKLNIVVTAAFVSNNGIDVYEHIARYVAKRLDGEAQLISGMSYDESNMLLEQGIIQVGFICGLPYTQQAARGKVQLVAIPVMAAKAGDVEGAPGYEAVPGKYYSYTIVHKDSPINSWQQLKGKSYAYNDKTSNSGYNMPRYKLVQLGATSWEEYFSRIEVSGSHEESIRMVARGQVDASSVDSLVLDYDRHRGNPDAMNVKIIETLFPGGAGAPPVVVGSTVSSELRQKLQHILTTMDQDEEGRKILASALLKRFAPPDDSNYDDIRLMEQAAIKAGFHDHRPQ